jgi:hypothetical protein
MTITPPRPHCLRLFAIGGFVFGGLALLAAGCDKHSLTVARPASAADAFALTANWPAFAQSSDVKADILFMVDDSSSMAPLQQKLIASFQAFADVLAGLPGGVPDLHIGVVSSSMGAGRNTGIMSCPPGGDRGVLRHAPVGSTCMGLQLTDPYIAVSTDGTTGQLVTNYGAASLADAFGCIAPLGDGGCGFEHQLASVLRALGGDDAAPPAENAGFLRPDAALAVVLLTNEDDCSAPATSDLFDDPASTPTWGPLTSYRCNQAGHVCLIDGRLQVPPSDRSVGPLLGCQSTEDGRLLNVSSFVAGLKKVKADPTRIFLAAFAGPPRPYTVGLEMDITGSGGLDAYIEHSCTADPTDYADPAVRIAQAVDAFGGQGYFDTICGATLTDGLGQIAARLARPTACIPTPAPGGPGCTVIDRWVDADGQREATRLPSCDDSGGTVPCFHLGGDGACAAGQVHLQIDRASMSVPSSLVTAIDCSAAHP